ncbi:hypothetical protein ACFVTY_04790, partial [Streptomyces sp. NPDC058067]|uniref:hypothetical protein n=1 Tax=Streptomyces sp. NPDC058067 TaxID=3346324 RepID=UPI0036EB99B3
MLVDPAELGTQTFVQVGNVRLPRVSASVAARHHEHPAPGRLVSITFRAWRQSLRIGVGVAREVTDRAGAGLAPRVSDGAEVAVGVAREVTDRAGAGLAPRVSDGAEVAVGVAREVT